MPPTRHVVIAFGLAAVLGVAAAAAQPVPARPEGTVVLMNGTAELEVVNDEALAQFYFEAQDSDLARAQAQVNQRVAVAVAQLRRADPGALLETTGYSSYPVYPPGGPRKPSGWRVRQGVSLRTTDLAALPRTVAAAQQSLALGGIDFRLSREARTKAESELIGRAIANLNDKIAAAAQALGVAATRVRLEELNFGVSAPMPIAPRIRAEAMASDAAPPAEPQLDAGRSLQQLTVTGRARLLPP